MCKIILFYEILAREYNAAKRIKKFLTEKYSCKVKIRSIIYEYGKAIKEAKKEGVDIIITPWMPNKKDYELLMPFLDINENLKVFNLYQEQIASDETLSITLLKDNIVKENVYHLCWGDYFKQLLVNNGVDESHALITGNARFDNAFNVSKNRESLANEFGLDLNKKWVLFAESRDWVIGDTNLKQRIRLGLPEDLEKESYFWHTKSLHATYNEMSNLPNDFFDKYELIYRPHPSTQAPEGIDKRVKIITDYNIYEWLGNIDYYITSTSTSIFEAEAMGVPTIVVQISDWPKTFETYGLNEYYRINSLLDFNEETILKAKEQNNGKKIFEKYIGKCDGKNAERLADKIIETSKNSNFKMMKVPYNNKFNLIKKLHYIYSVLMIKLNMPFLLLKGRGYYVDRNECPFTKKNKEMYKIEK